MLNSKGGVSNAPLKAVQDAAANQKSLDTLTQFHPQDPLNAVQDLDYDVLVDLSPTVLPAAEPSMTYWKTALERGKHVVSANKGPLAVDFRRFSDLAEQNGARILFEATVAGGTPVFNLARHCLNGPGLEKVEGILNGSTNYILTKMQQGIGFDDVVADARAKGYLEADASSDLQGKDALAKAVILANALFGQDTRYADHVPHGIDGITLQQVQAALAQGQCFKLIASVTPDSLSVGLQKIPLTHPLAQVGDAWNALTFYTKHADQVTIRGRGAGGMATASAVLNDLLELQAERR